MLLLLLLLLVVMEYSVQLVVEIVVVVVVVAVFLVCLSFLSYLSFLSSPSSLSSPEFIIHHHVFLFSSTPLYLLYSVSHSNSTFFSFFPESFNPDCCGCCCCCFCCSNCCCCCSILFALKYQNTYSPIMTDYNNLLIHSCEIIYLFSIHYTPTSIPTCSTHLLTPLHTTYRIA